MRSAAPGAQAWLFGDEEYDRIPRCTIIDTAGQYMTGLKVEVDL